MKTTLSTITIATIVLLASTTPAAEKWTVYTEWPFDATEAKRRQQETADAMGLPSRLTLPLGQYTSGKPVTMDLTLTPAGTFLMGTSQPRIPTRPSDEVGYYRALFWLAVALSACLAALGGYHGVREKNGHGRNGDDPWRACC